MAFAQRLQRIGRMLDDVVGENGVEIGVGEGQALDVGGERLGAGGAHRARLLGGEIDADIEARAVAQPRGEQPEPAAEFERVAEPVGHPADQPLGVGGDRAPLGLIAMRVDLQPPDVTMDGPRGGLRGGREEAGPVHQREVSAAIRAEQPDERRSRRENIRGVACDQAQPGWCRRRPVMDEIIGPVVDQRRVEIDLALVLALAGAVENPGEPRRIAGEFLRESLAQAGAPPPASSASARAGQRGISTGVASPPAKHGRRRSKPSGRNGARSS